MIPVGVRRHPTDNIVVDDNLRAGRDPGQSHARTGVEGVGTRTTRHTGELDGGIGQVVGAGAATAYAAKIITHRDGADVGAEGNLPGVEVRRVARLICAP